MVDALQRIPRLKEIVKETGCTLDQLREAMTRWDPDLTRRRVYFKYLLSKVIKSTAADITSTVELVPAALAIWQYFLPWCVHR